MDWGLENFIREGTQKAEEIAQRADQVSLPDPWEGPVRSYLEAHDRFALGTGNGDPWGVSQLSILEKCLDLPVQTITRDQQMRLTRIITGSRFTTHDGRFNWIAKRRRYPFINAAGKRQIPSGSVAGYMPVDRSNRVNLSDGVPTSDGTGRPAEMPWDNSDLTAPFQPGQPFS